MEQTSLRRYRGWFARLAMLLLTLGLGLAIGLTRRDMGTLADEKANRDSGGALESARIRNAVDIVEIDNLESQYANALDAGRLDEVADMNTPTGGRGTYYEDPVTTHLVVTGRPVDLNDQPLKNFPGCLMFGRENVIHYLHEGGDSIRPHVEGWKAGSKQGAHDYSWGTEISRHAIIDKWVVVTGDTATLHDYYGAERNSVIAESDLVRTPAGWKFQFRKVIFPKPTPDRACRIADPKFPIPAAGSLGGVPNFITPN